MKVLVIGGVADGRWWEFASEAQMPPSLRVVRCVVVDKKFRGYSSVCFYRLEALSAADRRIPIYAHADIPGEAIMQMLVDGYRKGGANG